MRRRVGRPRPRATVDAVFRLHVAVSVLCLAEELALTELLVKPVATAVHFPGPSPALLPPPPPPPMTTTRMKARDGRDRGRVSSEGSVSQTDQTEGDVTATGPVLELADGVEEVFALKVEDDVDFGERGKGVDVPAQR